MIYSIRHLGQVAQKKQLSESEAHVKNTRLRTIISRSIQQLHVNNSKIVLKCNLKAISLCNKHKISVRPRGTSIFQALVSRKGWKELRVPSLA